MSGVGRKKESPSRVHARSAYGLCITTRPRPAQDHDSCRDGPHLETFDRHLWKRVPHEVRIRQTIRAQYRQGHNSIQPMDGMLARTLRTNFLRSLGLHSHLLRCQWAFSRHIRIEGGIRARHSSDCHTVVPSQCPVSRGPLLPRSFPSENWTAWSSVQNHEPDVT